MDPFFPRMRSKGSHFTLGVWGLRVCSLDVTQPSATVRVMALWPLPMVSSAKGVAFGGFTCGVASFRVAGVALRDFQTCLQRVESRFVWQALYFRDVFAR